MKKYRSNHKEILLIKLLLSSIYFVTLRTHRKYEHKKQQLQQQLNSSKLILYIYNKKESKLKAEESDFFLFGSQTTISLVQHNLGKLCWAFCRKCDDLNLTLYVNNLINSVKNTDNGTGRGGGLDFADLKKVLTFSFCLVQVLLIWFPLSQSCWFHQF